MLTCEQQVARSSDYLDGQLPFVERLRMRQHLLFCPNCRRFIRQMRLAQQVIRQMPEPEPEHLEETVDRLLSERRDSNER